MMPFRQVPEGSPKVLIANRGEIAVRIARAVAELGWRSVTVCSVDDTEALHRLRGDEVVFLKASGAKAYLDGEALIRAALAHDCQMIHPGYGFLSERADFAEACKAAGLIFVGPTPKALAALGDKERSRLVAAEAGVQTPAGSGLLADANAAAGFMAELGRAVVLKAVAGGGGRGIRIVRNSAEIVEAFERCRSEAGASFGDDRIYAEELVERARHVEVQVVGDGMAVRVLGERECSLQRRRQKIVEFAPAPSLAPATRGELHEAAERIARHVGLSSLATMEFLVTPGETGDRILFMEVNPRLQVEHTVTEEVTGIDLVQLQLRLASGARLDDLVSGTIRPRGMAVQLRINTERMRADGSATAATGVVTRLELPSGPGIRVDTAAYAGFRNGLGFDSLFAKVIVHSAADDVGVLVRKAYRALCETEIAGIDTNVSFLRGLLRHPAVEAGEVDIAFVDRNLPDLLEVGTPHPDFHFANDDAEQAVAERIEVAVPEGCQPIVALNDSRLIELHVAPGDFVVPGQLIAITEAMKMEATLAAGFGGTVAVVAAEVGSALSEGSPIVFIRPDGTELNGEANGGPIDLDMVRCDLARVIEAHGKLLDAARPDAVQRRHADGQRTARENVEDLCDPGSFLESGGLAIAAQRGRRPLDQLQKLSPADGLITGTGTINADLFGAATTRCAVMAYDYTVFAGTQGVVAHTKKHRLFHLAEKNGLPVVLFAEGGGGRPGDTDDHGQLKLYNPTFWQLARLSGQVPILAIVSGNCFAGNAALAGCADLIIATENASVGMGGPAMIEGGGLGIVAAKDIGPMSMQAPNGVVDMVVKDEAAAVAAAKQVLSYLQGTLPSWDCADPRHLRHVIPEEPRRMYAMRDVLGLLADTGSVLELRPDYGVGIITALVRIEGRPIALMANNPAHLSGAIDSDAATKAADFCRLVGSFGLPLLKLCDTPGFMVGPNAEREGLVRQAGHMFIEGARLDVPQFTIIVRKGYGLGALAMVGGNSHDQEFCVSWPTGHFGKMGLEGQVKLGFRRELEQIADPIEREASLRKRVDDLYRHGDPLNAASYVTIDDVIDPVASRAWIVAGLDVAHRRAGRQRRALGGAHDAAM
ncbi:carboxyl transferase domain-containing protein [Mesorhizobium sp. 1B3]|uniref:acetyl-CoA carboxylase family protein n=1 Tax=Mesorhizobium sp. 1B3 TaxID=3243599 RepID=UPI003D99004F